MDTMPKKYKCLWIKQPFADSFARGRMTVHILPRKTAYRGEVIICAESGTGQMMGMQDGCWVARAVLKDCIPVSELTNEQIVLSDIITNNRKGWGWVLDDIRRLVEFPCEGRGFKDMELNEDDMVEYPTLVVLDKKGYEMIINGTWKRKRN